MSQQASLNDRRQALCEKVMWANFPAIGTPIRMGQESSVCHVSIERLYAESGKLCERISRSVTAAPAVMMHRSVKPVIDPDVPTAHRKQEP
jgi:multimeric flavodoxin WrbA